MTGHQADTAADKRVIEAYLDAVGELRVEDIAPLFTDEGRILLPYAPEGFPRSIDGREAIADYYAALPQMISALNFADYRILATEEAGTYVAQYTSDATMKTTGAAYRNVYITPVKIQDGRISELTEFFDPIRLVLALGGTVATG